MRHIPAWEASRSAHNGAEQSLSNTRLHEWFVPNPLSENTRCFLSLAAVALVIVKGSPGITQGQDSGGAQHLQTPLTSDTHAGAGRISWLGSQGWGAPGQRWERSLEVILNMPVSSLQAGFAVAGQGKCKDVYGR